ncbi:sigma-70 family RNA polymerase sigma factor [Ilyomonas limi]|uniref:Sigma-70 family RNA polymerase sigma factor n=1 Tax=Ilyomonas limi TaxID=2575867 RepID=A0A4U3LD84_9BACT|nr:sigma-70 family RNA polymerase sigma factor [Ilyomonas limi]TKK71877.1 sigma-70 family RNA polymerase sigma factor [Ilyomonas limi]
MQNEYNIHNKGSDEEVFASLLLLYYEDLYKYALKYIKDAEESKDSVNQFFIYVWEKRTFFQLASHTKSYVITSFKNFLIRSGSSLRQNEKKQQLYSLTLEDKELPYEAYILANQKETELKQHLQKAISNLSPRQKQLVQLKFYEHLSYEEIAEKTSLELRTVYNKLHEAIKQLRQSDIIQHLKKNIFIF